MKLKLLDNTSPYPTPNPLSTGCKNLEDFHSFLFFFCCQDFLWISRGSPYADIGDTR